MTDSVAPNPDQSSQITDMASELTALGISKEMQELLDRGLHSSKLPKQLRTARAAEAMQQAFELIGGVPRLALWADKNPDKFYPLFARMIPQTVAPVLPEATQTKHKLDDMPWLNHQRHLYKVPQAALEMPIDVPTKVSRGE